MCGRRRPSFGSLEVLGVSSSDGAADEVLVVESDPLDTALGVAVTGGGSCGHAIGRLVVGVVGVGVVMVLAGGDSDGGGACCLFGCPDVVVVVVPSLVG